MGKTLYLNFEEVNDLQTRIMVFVSWWVKTEKTPIPQKKIVEEMTRQGVIECTTINALNSLLKKGYIRRAHTISSKRTYVQCRFI